MGDYLKKTGLYLKSLPTTKRLKKVLKHSPPSYLSCSFMKIFSFSRILTKTE